MLPVFHQRTNILLPLLCHVLHPFFLPFSITGDICHWAHSSAPVVCLLCEFSLLSLPLTCFLICAGEEVSVVGFGVFGQACGPSVTSGILSAVITVANKPVMLQTTCAVHGGSSGGPLFSTHSGELLGKQMYFACFISFSSSFSGKLPVMY